MNYAITTKKWKGALRQLLMPLLSIFFAIALVCTSCPAPLAYAEGSSTDTTSVVAAASTDGTEDSGEGDVETGSEDGAEEAISDEATAETEASNEAKVGTLEVLLSDGGEIYTDVTTFENATTDWTLGALRTLHIDFEFASGTNKTITVSVPTGYMIVGCSMMDDAPAKANLKNIEIDPQYKEFFQSSTLVGIDGTTEWENQRLPEKYLQYMSSTASTVRIFGGIATYTFSDAATEGQLVMTLEPQCSLLSHTASTELLEEITVSMSSAESADAEPSAIKRSFQANVTAITKANMHHSVLGTWGPQSAYVPYDSETGLSDSFGVITTLSTYMGDNGYGEQTFYADHWTLTIDYPKGVSFGNTINCKYLGLGDNYTTSEEAYGASGQEIVPDHFTLYVTGDKTTGGQVIFEFANTTFFHSYSADTLGMYFTADATLADSDTLTFPVSMTLNNKGKTSQCANNRYRNLIANDGAYMITLTPCNRERRDIHADYPDFDGDYAMGEFDLHSKLPYADVPFLYDFSDLNGVRGVGVPGKNVRDIRVTTTEGREIELESVSGTSTGLYGVPITAEQLGLADEEYLAELTCTVDLDQMHYLNYYTNGMSYYGHFVNGQEGDVVMSILDENGDIAVNNEGKLLTATDHTNIEWNNSGFCNFYTVVRDENGSAATTFHPNEKIHFATSGQGGWTWSDADTVVDPVIMISLPEGINLDTSSVVAQSSAGNHGYESFHLAQVGTPLTMDIDGVEWTTYYYTSAEPLDMVAGEFYPGHNPTHIRVDFDAYVSSNSPEYGQISLADCVQWDLGATSVNSNSGATMHEEDIYNRAGKGTTYRVYGTGDNFTVKPLIGLNVDLGIRVMGSGTDFFTYNTTESSIAGLLKDERAEVQVTYENTASTDYFKNSAIYLPVPRVGNDYAKFFQNIEVADPLNVENNTTFQFDAYLESPVEMDGFTTYYATSVTESTASYDPSTNASTWAPVEAEWLTYDELTAEDLKLSDVIFMKLVANRDIPTGESGSTTFELSVSENAQLDQVDYWRAYSKAVTDQTDDTGVWNYSSVIAATPVNFGVSGQFFLDLNEDGKFDANAGDEAYTDGKVTAILSRDGGGMDNILLTVAEDGSFRSLNENGTDYYLKTGNYTITFASSDEVFVYSPIAGAEASSEAAWYNDLEAANISDSTATYHFTVSADTTLGTYVGVALIPEVISIDVPVRVDIALKTDGTWCTPTALGNRIINHSTCDIRVASAETTPTSGFSMLAADEVESSTQNNVFGGTIQPQDGTTQDLADIICPTAEWVMESGFASAGENELALQLTGTIENVEGWFFPAGIHAFDITYTFEKATAGGE